MVTLLIGELSLSVMKALWMIVTKNLYSGPQYQLVTNIDTNSIHSAIRLSPQPRILYADNLIG
jgi:hypothetical protein